MSAARSAGYGWVRRVPAALSPEAMHTAPPGVLPYHDRRLARARSQTPTEITVAQLFAYAKNPTPTKLIVSDQYACVIVLWLWGL